MNSLIVIPARYASSRFPGKPLEKIAGVAMLERCWRIAKETSASEVIIATDDERIEKAATSFGANVVMTNSSCKNGTERVFDAIKSVDSPPDFVVNLQGDAVLTPPWVIQALIDEMQSNPGVDVATPAVELTMDQYSELLERKKRGITAGTFVVFDLKGNALYFSKSPIPFPRVIREGSIPGHRHVGLYAYRQPTLKKYLELPATELEVIEGLEQLRLLENQIPIKVVLVDYKGRTHASVDSPEDIELIESIIKREGELVLDTVRA